MRVAYSWTKKTWTEILERTAEAGGSDWGVRRGWIQGDSLEVEDRGRLGEMYQVIVGGHGGMRSEEDGAVKLSESDLRGERRASVHRQPEGCGIECRDRRQGKVASWGRIVRRERGEGHKVIERKGVERMKRTMTWPQTWEATHRRWAR